MKSQLRRAKKDIAEDLKARLRPRVDSCKTQDEVFETARKLIYDAHTEKVDEDRYITFYGAAHLGVSESESDEFGTVGGSGQVSPYQKYAGALEAATGDKVRMRRYIKLFTKEEFQKRSFNIQRDYVNWLKSQYNMLSRNPNYVLGDIVRAPQWGGNLARIITHSAMMEITGTGEAAFVITDNFLCGAIRRSTRETIVGGKQAKNKPEYYGQARECNKTVVDFRNHITGMERAVSSRTAGDEEGR
jgi:hypothetical protein